MQSSQEEEHSKIIVVRFPGTLNMKMKRIGRRKEVTAQSRWHSFVKYLNSNGELL